MKKKYLGFTLIEIMIALIIFAIIATITTTSMQNALTTREVLTKNMENLTKWQIALSMLEQDFSQIIDRPIRTGNMIELAALNGNNNSVEFTRSGIFNDENLNINLQRVSWICKNGSLIRRHWKVLDPPDINTFSEQQFLDNLTQCTFNYISHQKQSKKNWNTDTNTQEYMPLAIQVSLNKNVNLIFALPGAN